MYRGLVRVVLVLAIATLSMPARESFGACVISRQASGLSPEDSESAEFHRLIRAHEWDSAVKIGEQLIVRWPTDPNVLFWLGYVQSRRNDFIDAVALLRRVEKVRPDQPGLPKLLASCYYDMSQYVLFEYEIRRAIAQTPHDGELYYLLGYYQTYVRSEYDAAANSLQRALDEEPTAYRFHYLLGYVHECKDENQKARQEFLRAIEQCEASSPCDFALPYLGMARLAFASDPGGALKYVQRAVEIDPNSSEAQLWLGKIRLKLGDVRSAADAFLKACALDPTSVTPRYLLSEVYKREGNYQAAAKYLAEFNRLSSLYGRQ